MRGPKAARPMAGGGRAGGRARREVGGRVEPVGEDVRRDLSKGGFSPPAEGGGVRGEGAGGTDQAWRGPSTFSNAAEAAAQAGSLSRALSAALKGSGRMGPS